MSQPRDCARVRRVSQGQPRLRRQRYPLIRRDPRRFARGMAKITALPQPTGLVISSDIRLFAHTFGAAFLFVLVFLA